MPAFHAKSSRLSQGFEKEPERPPETEWKFLADLQKPYWQNVVWERRDPAAGEACLGNGVAIKANFPDPDKVLDSAYQDLARFLKLGNIPTSGRYHIVTDVVPVAIPEAFRLEVTATECRILAGDTEGIRRGIYFIEDEMLRRGGPFLLLGSIRKCPVIRTRISRPYWGGNALPDDKTRYYPDEYLNRVAHHGVNGFLQLSAEGTGFREICPSKLIPECGRDSARSLAVLRDMVRHYARFGIRYYIYWCEPAAFRNNSPIPIKYPELAGHCVGKTTHFCISSKLGQAYLEEAAYTLFSAVPGLGGLINICCGERPSHCCSAGAGVGDQVNNCSRCSKRDPQDVLADTLAAMERGMHAAAPKAELIAWPYSQYLGWGEKETIKTAGRIPKGVILQHNFESDGKCRQLGKIRTADDYWLSWPGPSRLFRDCAGAAAGNNTRISAKIMVSCSHEVESIPFVPVPGIIYDKYKSMHELGVSCALMCWGSGSYPSINYRAAHEMSFAGFPGSKTDLLFRLAQHDWGKNAPKVVMAWDFFEKGYRNFPVNHVFGYYGTMHDGPVWPLHLAPVDKGLTPNYAFIATPSVSGDRIGECITYSHTLEETLVLCKRMSDYWHRGTVIFEALLPEYAGDTERLKDIRVALALDCQFASGFNILRFYALREQMLLRDDSGRMELLEQMRTIVEAELKIDEQLLALSRAEPTLGFTSEAGGYRYFPAKIEWRMKLLCRLLENEFPRVKRKIMAGQKLFPEYTGKMPKGPRYHCRRLALTPAMNGNPSGKGWDDLEAVECSYKAFLSSGGQYTVLSDKAGKMRETSWKAGYDKDALYFGITCAEPDMAGLCDDYKDRKMPAYSPASLFGNDCVIVEIEPRRLWPCQLFFVNPQGARCYDKVRLVTGRYGWEAAARQSKNGWSVTLRIPFAVLGADITSKRPLRMNVIRNLPKPPQGQDIHSWITVHPLPYRLVWGTKNPADLGWLIFER